MHFFTILGFVSLIIFIIPFVLKNKKKYLIIYIWISFGFLSFILGQNYYWEYAHPGADNSGAGAAIIYLAFFIFFGANIIPIIIVIIWKKLFISVFKGFIFPLIILFISLNILFQGFLLFSAYNAYNSAKQMQTKNISKQNMLDFYSPFIKHISVEAGEAKRWYRWSYHRAKYVFEVRQYTNYISNSEDKNDTVYYFPHYQYAKEFKLSIPKVYLLKDRDLSELVKITIPSNINWSYYFNFSKKYIEIDTYGYDSNYFKKIIYKKIGKQFELTKAMGSGYYDNDYSEKYGNKYLTYFNKTVSIQCHYLENNTTSNICHMKMIANGFRYQFDISKEYISKWEQISTKLSGLFESFIVDTKRYPKTLSPYKE